MNTALGNQDNDNENNEVSVIIMIVLLIISVFLQGFPLYFVLKNRKVKPIMIRSPILTIFNTIGLFFMNFVYFLYVILLKNNSKMDNFFNFLGDHYFEFHLLFKITYIAKLHRIHKIVKVEAIIKENPGLEGLLKNSFLESTYLIFCLTVIFFSFIIRIIVMIVMEDKDFMMPFIFYDCRKNKDPEIILISTTIFWIIVDFIDQIITATTTYFLYKSIFFQKHYLLSLELILYIVTWIFYSNVMRICQFCFDNFPAEITSFLCCMFINITVLVVEYIPLLSLYT